MGSKLQTRPQPPCLALMFVRPPFAFDPFPSEHCPLFQKKKKKKKARDPEVFKTDNIQLLARFTLTVADWMKSREQRMLCDFRSAPPWSPAGEVGEWSFFRELRDQRENAPPSFPLD